MLIWHPALTAESVFQREARLNDDTADEVGGESPHLGRESFFGIWIVEDDEFEVLPSEEGGLLAFVVSNGMPINPAWVISRGHWDRPSPIAP